MLFSISRNYAVNGLNQYTSAGPATFTYDANGNLTGDGSSTYVYDIENRLISASGATTATLRYDPLGRLYETGGGAAGITRFLYDGDELVAEYNSSGAMLRRYVHGSGNDDPMAWFEGASVDTNVAKLIKTNHQGSVIALTDWNGTLTNINRYDEWGIPAANNTGRFQYTGQAWLPELGMYHYKARIYSPTLERFLQTDPIGYDDQVNLYAYVGNDPVNNTDPTGNDTCPDGSREICVTGTKTSPPPSTPPPPSGHTKLGVINRPGGDVSKPKPPEREKDDPPPCNLAQRGLQKLGSYGVKLGGDVTTAGLVITGGGLAVAGVSANTVVLAPGGVLLGGSIATGGANVAAGGGVIGTGGALLMLAGGSGKAAVSDLASRVVSSRIPKSFGGEIISELVGQAVDAIPFEFKICK